MSQTYRSDDIVWAKMRNYVPWPGLVTDPKIATVKQPTTKNQVFHWIYFFGSDNFAWIEESNLKPYEPFKERMISKYMPSKVGEIKKKSFPDAVNQIEIYIKEKKKNPKYKPYEDVIKDIEFDNIRNEKPIIVNDKKRKLVQQKKPIVTKKVRSEIGDDLIEKSNNSISSTVENNNVHSFYDDDHQELDDVLDLKTKASALKQKTIVPLQKKIGFLGIGKMGAGLVKNLRHSGHDVTIWDRNTEKCEQFEKELGVELASNPANLVERTDIIFSCLSEPRVSKDAVYMNCGMKDYFTSSKAFIELSSMNTEVSLDLSEPILKVGGRYLEAQVQGDIKLANDGTVIFVTAGDESLFYEIQPCFEAMGSYSCYLGANIGDACIMNLAIQTLKATTLAGLAEAMAVVDGFKLKFNDLMEILGRSQMSSEFLKSKHEQISKKKYENRLTLKYLQKDLRLLFDVADQIKQPLPIAVNTNEVFKQAIRNGYGNMDASAIYEYIRH